MRPNESKHKGDAGVRISERTCLAARFLRAGGLVALVVAVEGALVVAARRAASDLRGLLAQPSGELSAALGDVATVVALCAWTWLLLLVVATVASALVAVKLPHAHGLTSHLAPRAARRAVVTLLGMGAALTTGTAPAAAYDSPQHMATAGLRWGVQAGTEANPLEGLPLPDRPSGTGLPNGPTSERQPQTVVVRRGDTLWSIAAGAIGNNPSIAAIARRWPDWYAANRAVIGDDPDLLLPGTVLEEPPPRHPLRHTLPPDERS